MTLAIEPPETDLRLPMPAPGEVVHPYTVHTHYFGFSVPEAGIGAYLYARYMPYYRMAQAGPTIFRGMDNLTLLDADYADYRTTMPWPEIDGARIRFESGYEIDVVEPGSLIRLSYVSPDGEVSFELEQRAITPLLARTHVVPGEEDHHDTPGLAHGGTEQFMHCTGHLRLRGEEFDVDCYPVRDRSWNQIRTEDPGGAKPSPPTSWTPLYMGPDMALNVTGFEDPDTDPAWAGTVELPAGTPTSFYKWLVRDGRQVEITGVRRNVLEYHPQLYSAIRQELEVSDETGATHRFEGRALAMAPIHTWPNIGFTDSLFEWQDEHGRITHCTYQEVWWDRYAHKMKLRRERLTTQSHPAPARGAAHR